MKKIICLLLIMVTVFSLSCDKGDLDNGTTTTTTTSGQQNLPTPPPQNPPRIVPSGYESYDYLAYEADIQPLRQDIYAVKGGYNLPMNIFAPEVENANNNVAILCIHGGGWNTSLRVGSTFTGDWMRHQARYYASLGFYALEITYRSVNQGFTIKDLQADVEDAMRYINQTVKAEFGIDKVITIGDSAGGHLVLCLALAEDESLRPYATIACNPVSNCVGTIWTGGISDPEVGKTVSPLHLAKKTDGKILIMHGTADTVVDPGDSQALYDALAEKVEAMQELQAVYKKLYEQRFKNLEGKNESSRTLHS
jgi:acetyl esterase/lipase